MKWLLLALLFGAGIWYIANDVSSASTRDRSEETLLRNALLFVHLCVAALVGFGQGTGYRSNPVMRGEVEGIPESHEQHLSFEHVEQVAASNSLQWQ